MAGNIPLVGFHDFLSVLIAGHKIIIKLSGDDPFLITAMSRLLCDINPDWESRIRFSEGALKGFDAIIATGSDNTSRHFDFYFRKYPHIIRHHRNSIAILTGREEPETLRLLASDILQYFGLGCRNISKLYLPVDYNLSLIEEAVKPYLHLLNHHKYRNNYDYNRTMFMLNQIPYRELGPILVTESKETASRIAVLHYSYYSDFEALNLEIDELSGQIQCIVCQEPISNLVIYPGKTQSPGLEEYADQVNTLDFLAKI
jgi:hypothetical protein